MTHLSPGDIVWADGDPVVGREQGGRRPYLVVSSQDYLDLADTLMMAVPITTSRRGWSNHVPALGDTQLTRASWIMTEQLRVLSRDRVFGRLGAVSPQCLARVRMWVGEFLGVS